MPQSTDTVTNSNMHEDEIDLRALFATVWGHKWFILWFTFLITLIVVVFAYRMPKYYKTTTVIEVKAKSDSKQSGLSLGNALGGAGALLGLAGLDGNRDGDAALDAAKMTLYRTNKHILDTVHYNAQYLYPKDFVPWSYRRITALFR